MEFLSDWGVDEIILLDISAAKEGRAPDHLWYVMALSTAMYL